MSRLARDSLYFDAGLWVGWGGKGGRTCVRARAALAANNSLMESARTRMCNT